MTRLRDAFDLLAWPLVTTLASLLPRRWGGWVRDSPEDEDDYLA